MLRIKITGLRILPATAILLGLGAALVLLLGYGGGLHPAGDSFAVFRVEAAIVLGFGAYVIAILGNRRLGLGCAAFAVFAAAPIVWNMRAAPAEGTFSLYQKNLLFANRTQAEAVQDILDLDPDFVTLQEVTEASAVVMSRLGEVYPVRVVCPFSRVGGVAVLSRWPVAAGGVVCDLTARRGYVAVQIDTPDGPLWVVSVHLHWPWPHRQGDQVGKVAEELAQLDGPVLMAGDFNMVPWSASLRRLSRATGTTRIGPIEQTIRRPEVPWLPLRIDHVYVPEGWVGGVNRRPLLGSDHFGLFARFGPDG